MILLRLFFEFAKVGLFAVGGGMATVPFMYDIADRTGWFTHELLADMIAVSESTPGPIGVNMATYVGYVTAGYPGSVAATHSWDSTESDARKRAKQCSLVKRVIDEYYPEAVWSPRGSLI